MERLIKQSGLQANGCTARGHSQAGELITVCKGFPHNYNYSGCSGVAQTGNKYVPSPSAPK
jgi:hypothetical protein